MQFAAAQPTPSPHTTPAIRVVIGDDHSLMLRMLRLLLERDGLEVVADAADVPAAIRHVHKQRPDVLVLDLSMPSGDSLDAIRRLRIQVPRTEIVVLAMEDDPAYARQAIEAGALGYVLKDVADTDLPAAVRNAVRGEPFVSRRVGALLQALRAG